MDLRYCDGKVSLDVLAAAAFLKDTLDKEGIGELISNLSKYKGKQCSNDFKYGICIFSKENVFPVVHVLLYHFQHLRAACDKIVSMFMYYKTVTETFNHV